MAARMVAGSHGGIHPLNHVAAACVDWHTPEASGSCSSGSPSSPEQLNPAVLFRTDLTKAVFADANLTSAVLSDASLTRAALMRATMRRNHRRRPPHHRQEISGYKTYATQRSRSCEQHFGPRR